MRRIGLCLAASTMVLGLVACGGADDEVSGAASEAQLQTVDVGHVALPIFAPLYVADAKGYFEEEGIEIKLQNIKSGQDGIPLAASGQLDVLAAGLSAGMFSAIETGLDIKTVGSMGVAPEESEPSPSALIVSKQMVESGEFKTLEDLEGLNVGTLGGIGGTSTYYISMALEEAGLSIKDVNLVNLSSPDMPAALQNGSIDAAFVSAPFWELAVNDGVADKVWTTPEGTSGTGLIYGGPFADSELAQPFFNAIARGSQDLQGEERYSEENLEIIGQYTDQTAEAVGSVPLYTWFPDLHPLPEQMADMEATWMEIGALEYSEAIPQENYVATEFSENIGSKPGK